MAVPLSHDRTAAIMGVDLAHHGLLCRATGCREQFAVAGSETTERAAGLRDAHEIGVHSYRHEITPNAAWGFERKFSRGGRSTMGRR